MIEAYPLHWPAGRPRSRWQDESRFRVSMAQARDGLLAEIDRLGGTLPVISTNVELRRDGQPYANRCEPHDVGVAVYFTYGQRQMCFACDRWDCVGDNLQAIRKTIEAIRGIERWGSGDMLESAFSGFEALPPPEQWWAVLECPSDADMSAIHSAYRARAKDTHPDSGGSVDAFQRVQRAYQQAQEARA